MAGFLLGFSTAGRLLPYMIEVIVLVLTGKGRYTKRAETTCRDVCSCSGCKMMCCPLTEHNKA